MKLTFLGTAAAEAIPAFYCECESCTNARMHGGKDVRKRCSYLLDDDTLIDYGPDIFFQTIENHINLLHIKQILFTHAHEDHLDAVEFLWRRKGFAQDSIPQLAVYGGPAVLKKISEVCRSFEACRMEPHEVHPEDRLQIGDMEVIVLEAVHDPAASPLNYIIRRGGKNLLIANDTGIWKDRNFEICSGLGFTLDAAVIECCGVFIPGRWYDQHLAKDTMLEFRDRLRQTGILTDKTRCVMNHFSHNGQGVIHSRIEEFFNLLGFEVAYDTKTIEI